jgi:hypothetical protein
MLLRTCLALFVVTGAWAQQTRPANPAPKRDSPPARSSFTAKGLNHEQDLTDLFVGNFADLSFDRGSVAFSQLFETYLEAYWRYCSDSLPPNKIEMTTLECADPPAPIRLPSDGPPPQPHGCLTWKKVSLGWADPALYAAKRQFDLQQSVNQLKDMVGSIKNPMRMIVGAGELSGDTDAMVRLNACGGPGLKRFEDNVALFSMGKQPLLLPGEPPPVAPKALSAGALADSDYNRFIEDLIADQAKTWLANRYLPGSTSQMIVAHDPRGQPSQIRAKYFFTSPLQSGRAQGSVTVSFTDGIPACIYFSDAPSTCQTPDRRLVTRYSSGGYVDQNAVRAKADAEAREGVNICVPDDLLAEWKNPPPGSKMVAFQRRLRADSFFVGHAEAHDESSWITLNSNVFSTWNPTGRFNGVIKITDGGSCAVGHREFLALNP